MAQLLVFTPTWIDPSTGEDAIAPECEASIKAQAYGFGDFDWHVTADNPFPVGDHRNVLRQYQQARAWFLSNDRYDALVTVEHDMVLADPHTFEKMVETPGDVIYAPYMLRHGLRLLSAFRYPGGTPPDVADSLSYYPDELKQARESWVWRVSGAGCGRDRGDCVG